MVRALFLICFFLSHWSHAKERLGELRVDKVLLKPRIQTTEPFRVDMNLGESMVGFRWDYKDDTSAYVAIGTENLIGKSAWVYADLERQQSDLTLVEAYGMTSGDTGVWRFGLQACTSPS